MLQQGQSEPRILAVSNLGNADLEWEQFGGPGCALPSQWVSAQPLAGSVAPGKSQDLTLTFHPTTNLIAGTYMATLCLTSNDPGNPMVSVPLTLTVTPAADVHVLFNQITGVTTGFVPAQRFLPPSPIDATGADDFMVFEADGWTISQFNFDTQFTAAPPIVDVRVYPDDNGRPGEPALCSYDEIGATIHGGILPRLRVPLPAPCVLNQGRYWVSLTRSGGSLEWAVGTPDPFPPPFGLGAHAHWRNPGNGFETGCTDWADILTCLDKKGVPVGGGGDQLKFQVCGAVGMDGRAVGCGDENAQATLAITLALDDGNPNQCGAATTLDVVAGSRVNVCYTVTNAGNAPLRFHWLRDNLNTRPLSRSQTVDPGQALQFNRLINATQSQTITAEAQATDVLPWYYTAQQGFDFVDISSSGTPLNLGDDASANVTLPFRFNLFGVATDQVCINNNGFILLDWSRPCDGFHADAAIPNENVPLGAAQIAPFWDDLFTGGNVYYEIVGTAPHRRFIVQWHQKNHYNNGASDPGSVTFELILDETTNNISFQYLDTTFDNPQRPEWDRGGSATIGFQSYVRNGFGGPWRSLPFHQPSVHPQTGLTYQPMGFFHALANGAATLHVNAPAIALNPEAVQAAVAPGGSTSAPLTISNTGTLNLQWQGGTSPLGPTSHFPAAGVATAGSEEVSANPNLWDRPPAEKLKLRVNPDAPAADAAKTFATRAFAVRYAFDTPPFPTLYQRLNDITNPADTTEIGDLVARDIFAGAFIGSDFSRQYGIDDCCGHLLTIDTATGLPSINLGRIQRNPALLGRFWGMTWDATTGTLYTVASDTFSILPDTRFFLVRLDRGHEVVAVPIGELPGISQGVAMFGIAVDAIGRMFGIDVLGDRLFAIDKNTAQISAIGSLGFSANGALGFDFDDGTGTLYLTSIDDASGTSSLYTVNTLTGQASVVGPLVNGNQHSALAIAAGAPCVPPSDVPWLSLNPPSGSLAPGNSEPVTVHMDASELTAGTYQANICFGSNDPVRPVVAVPVTLQVTGGVPPAPTQVVSRKLHSGMPFDVVLPLTGNPGVECRSGGGSNAHQVVFTFAAPVTFSGASVTSGTGSVLTSSGTGTNTITVDLTGVSNAQTVSVTLANVSNGSASGNVVVPLGVLLGDTNGNRVVTASDIGQVKSQSGQSATAANFRNDVNTSGSINASDIGQVKTQSGTSLP